MNWIRLAMLVGLAGSAAAMAQEAPPGPGPGLRRPTTREAGGGGHRARFRGGPEEQVDWADVEQFMKANSPHRWAAYESLPGNKRGPVRQFIMMRYRMLQGMKRDEELYEVKKQEIRLEDEVYRVRQELGKADTAGSDKLKEEMRAMVRKLVELRLAERARRLEHLKAAVADETRRLEEDRANTDKLVEQRYNAELAGEPPPMEHPPFGRRPGEGPRK